MYRELKEKCPNGVKETEDAITKVKNATQIASCNEKNNNGIISIECYLIFSGSKIKLNQDRI